jgi:hypothetical protein
MSYQGILMELFIHESFHYFWVEIMLQCIRIVVVIANIVKNVYFTVAMMFTSAVLSRITVSGKVEAAFQNFAAGLILAAGKLLLYLILFRYPKLI